MQTNKKKPFVPMIIIGAFLSAYLGYLVNGAWKTGMEFGAFMESLEEVLAYPLRDYCTKPLRGSTIKIRFLLNFNFRCTECVYDLILSI